MIKVLFFGPIAAAIGEREMKIAHQPGLTLGGLHDTFSAQHPAAMRLPTMMAAKG